jgi:hypothetical protein
VTDATPKSAMALAATKGACRPCGRLRRFKPITIMRPPKIPIAAPSSASVASVSRTCCQEPSRLTRNSISSKVRKTANGSLLPDSTSRVAATRGRRCRPPAWIRKNTAAASVEATVAPSSSDSTQGRPSIQWAAGAVSIAVTSTPAVASVIAGAKTWRKVV